MPPLPFCGVSRPPLVPLFPPLALPGSSFAMSPHSCSSALARRSESRSLLPLHSVPRSLFAFSLAFGYSRPFPGRGCLWFLPTRVWGLSRSSCYISGTSFLCFIAYLALSFRSFPFSNFFCVPPTLSVLWPWARVAPPFLRSFVSSDMPFFSPLCPISRHFWASLVAFCLPGHFWGLPTVVTGLPLRFVRVAAPPRSVLLLHPGFVLGCLFSVCCWLFWHLVSRQPCVVVFSCCFCFLSAMALVGGWRFVAFSPPPSGSSAPFYSPFCSAP